MHEDIEHGASIALSGVDDSLTDRVPAAAVKHGARGVEYGVPGIGNAVRNHSSGRQTVEELVENFFNAACSEFGSRDFNG